MSRLHSTAFLAFSTLAAAHLCTAQEVEPSAPQLTNASAQEWRSWRGLHNAGCATEATPPITWSETENLLWKIDLPGHGKSTPIICGQRLFLLAAEPSTEASAEELASRTLFEDQFTAAPSTKMRFSVLAFDRDSGKSLWRREVAERLPVAGVHQTNGYASFSPVCDEKHVYAVFGSYGVYALKCESGEVVWSYELGPQRLRRGWGEGGSPALHEGTLVVVADQESNSSIVALDAATGAVRWKQERDEISTWTTPLILDAAGYTQVIVNGTKAVRSYNLEDGEELWRCGGQTVNAIPCIVSDGRVAYAMSGYQGAACMALRLDRRGDLATQEGALLWKHAKGTPYVPSPLLVDGKLYFSSGNAGLLSCIEASSGKLLFDRERLELSGIYASPLYAAGRIYITGRDGTTLVLRHGETLEILASNSLDDGIDASPVAVGNTLYLRSDAHLYAFRAEQK